MKLTAIHFPAEHRGIEIKGAASTDGFYFTSKIYQGFEPGFYDKALERFKKTLDQRIKLYTRLNSKCKYGPCSKRCFNQNKSATWGQNEARSDTNHHSAD